jgi:hypothetical protein
MKLVAVSPLVFLSLSLPAAAQDYKVTGQFGAFGVGKATELEKDHLSAQSASIFREDDHDHSSASDPRT